jgi:hypothetical protein
MDVVDDDQSWMEQEGCGDCGGGSWVMGLGRLRSESVVQKQLVCEFFVLGEKCISVEKNTDLINAATNTSSVRMTVIRWKATHVHASYPMLSSCTILGSTSTASRARRCSKKAKNGG